MAFGALAYDPMTGLAITPEEPGADLPAVRPQGAISKAINRLAGTQFGEPRMQTWPEKLVRSAVTLPGDIASGEQPMLPPGVRREDYTDAPPPPGLTVTAQPNDPAYERAQDLAGMAGGGMMFGRLAPGAGEAAAAAVAPKPAAASARPAASLLADSSVPGAPIAALEHAPKFYSGAERVVEAIPQPRMTGEQWLGTLNNRGVKPEEMDWTGLRGFLAERGNQPVTKAQVAEHLDANKLELGEVHKGGEPRGWDDLSAQEQNAVWRNYRESTGETRSIHDPDVRDWWNETYPMAESVETKFSSYQLPGGENYREKLLTLPLKKEEIRGIDQSWRTEKLEHGNGYRAIGNYDGDSNALLAYGATPEEALQNAVKETSGTWKNDYRSSHWDEPNVLVHRRTNERDVNGQPSLHIEEIQSDWHQQGRKQGYDTGPKEAFTVVEGGHQRGQYDTRAEAEAAARQMGGGEVKSIPVQGSGVPDAPFKKNWHELALKDAIREAAEKGIDRISWTPGEAQAARYDLSQHIKEIEYVKNGDGTYRLGIVDKDGEPIRSVPNGIDVNRMTLPQIEQTVGKEIADKVSKDAGKKYRGHDGYTLEGVDLKVGGEGMRGFYDKMIPDALNKIGKPHGVKVQMSAPATAPMVEPLRNGAGESLLGIQGSDAGPFRNMAELNKWWKKNGDVPVHYMDIPQSLKDQVLKKGFSLFEDAAIGAPLAGVERADHPATAYHALLDPVK